MPPSLGLIGAGGAAAATQALRLIEEDKLRRRLLQEQQDLAVRRQGEVERGNLANEALTSRGLGQGDVRLQHDATRLGYEGDRLGLDRNADTRAAADEARRATAFKIAEDNRNRLTDMIRLMPEGATKTLLGLRSVGGEAQRDDLMSAQQRGAEKGQELLAAENAGGRDVFRGRTQIEANFRPAPAAQSRLVQVENPDGTVTWEAQDDALGQKVGRVGPEAKATGEQQKHRDFYTRMRSALDDMDAVEGQLTNTDLAILHGSPLPGAVNNMLLSKAGQKYAQALSAYSLAKLRDESGAAINVGEFTKEQLLAARQLGDDPETLAQRKRTREGVAEGFAAKAGKAYDEYYGKPFEPGGKSGGGRVRVQGPNGETGTIDKSDVGTLGPGWKVIGG